MIPRNSNREVARDHCIRKIHKLSSMVAHFLTEQGNQFRTYDINDIIAIAKNVKKLPPDRPIVSDIGTSTEYFPGLIDSII